MSKKIKVEKCHWTWQHNVIFDLDKSNFNGLVREIVMSEEVETMRSYPNFKRMFYSRKYNKNRQVFRENKSQRNFSILQKRKVNVLRWQEIQSSMENGFISDMEEVFVLL